MAQLPDGLLAVAPQWRKTLADLEALLKPEPFLLVVEAIDDAREVYCGGKLIGTATPGLGFKIPFIDSIVKISLETQRVQFDKVNSYSRDQQPADDVRRQPAPAVGDRRAQPRGRRPLPGGGAGGSSREPRRPHAQVFVLLVGEPRRATGAGGTFPARSSGPS